MTPPTYSRPAFALSPTPGMLWSLTLPDGAAFGFAPPTFEVDGQAIVAWVPAWEEGGAARDLPGGGREESWRGQIAGSTGRALTLTVQSAPDSALVRFRYTLHGPGRLTKTGGRDRLTYAGIDLAALPHVTEVRLGEFNARVHSYCLSEREVGPDQFEAGLTLMGPILAAASDTHALALAYEHGSTVPDAFLAFRLGQDRTVALDAVRGSYLDGQEADGFQTPWLHAGAAWGGVDDLARAYRDFLLRGVTANAASRTPFIFYNTWNFQERNRWANGQPYLASMNQERILAEIDVAGKMGVDVFVLDTGWYEKTGDWQVNRQRFPDGLKAVKAALDERGMALGLWFNPTVAAISSRMRRDHEDCVMQWHGAAPAPAPVWETEDSQGLCLVSRYWEAFADELIRLSREVGVTYFKWDAIGQFGCDAPGHHHGTDQHTRQERADSYAFQQVDYLARIVDRLCAACPEAIVDFDITEGGRSVGLGFLAAGKYFLINNGPYNQSYDLKPPADGNVNLFFFPGPARAWICRTPLLYDKWVPSVLFLTHYLPDDPAESQELNVASLVLGQNGLWGDLPGVSPEGVARIGAALRAYKQVRGDITRATLTRTGDVGGSPEVYEKIDPATGRGVVSVFASAPGVYTYLTQVRADPLYWAMPGLAVTPRPGGKMRLDITFAAPGGKCVFFGAEKTGKQN